MSDAERELSTAYEAIGQLTALSSASHRGLEVEIARLSQRITDLERDLSVEVDAGHDTVERAESAERKLDEARAEIEHLQADKIGLAKHLGRVVNLCAKEFARANAMQADNVELSEIGAALTKERDKLVRELANRNDRLAMLRQARDAAYREGQANICDRVEKLARHLGATHKGSSEVDVGHRLAYLQVADSVKSILHPVEP